MLDDAAIKEQLSYAYVHAVASRAGFSCERRSMDRDSVDLAIHARRKLEPSSVINSPCLEIQLKSTSHPKLQNDRYVFPLEMRAYNDLRAPTMVPRLLVLFVLPRDDTKWLLHNEDKLVSKKCAYWVSLRNASDSPNQSQKTIYVPRQNVFSPDALRELLVKASCREEIVYANK